MSPAPPRLPLTIIVAVSPTNGIGAGGTLPWRLSREMAYFKQVTSNAPAGSKNAVIMGRNTWESIPPRFRPLGGRVNLVISRTSTAEQLGINTSQDSHLFSSPTAALDYLRERSASQSPTPLSRVFLIGGAQLYSQALKSAQKAVVEGQADEWNLARLLITRIAAPKFPECDVFLPEFRTQQQIEDEAQSGGSSASEDRTERSSSSPLTTQVWQRASGTELQQYTAVTVPGIDSLTDVQEEKGVSYEFQMWTRPSQ